MYTVLGTGTRVSVDPGSGVRVEVEVEVAVHVELVLDDLLDVAVEALHSVQLEVQVVRQRVERQQAAHDLRRRQRLVPVAQRHGLRKRVGQRPGAVPVERGQRRPARRRAGQGRRRVRRQRAAAPRRRRLRERVQGSLGRRRAGRCPQGL
ncbi:unnamed protein product [Ixodes hexagonus]